MFAETYSGLIAYELYKLKNINIKHVIDADVFLDRPSVLTKLNVFLPLSIVGMKLIPTMLLSFILFGDFQRNDLINLFYKSFHSANNKSLRFRLGIISKLPKATSNINIPTTYIRAQEDFLVNKRCIRTFEKHFNNLETVIFIGGHFIAQANPEECWLLIQNKLQFKK